MKARKNTLKYHSLKLGHTAPKVEQWLFEILIAQKFPGNQLNCRYAIKHGQKTNGQYRHFLKNTYIPDIVSHKHRFLIELCPKGQGKEVISKKHSARNKYYSKNGYKIIQIQPFKKESLNNGLNKLYLYLMDQVKDEGLVKLIQYWSRQLYLKDRKQIGKEPTKSSTLVSGAT
jgi:very-short-patch-repair endonuclease